MQNEDVEELIDALNQLPTAYHIQLDATKLSSETRPMQRLKQHNIGAHLTLNDADFILAQGPALPYRGTLRWIRMRIELGGYAERSYHEIGREVSVFSHRTAQFDAASLAEVVNALRAAGSESCCDETGFSPDKSYRRIEFRDGREVRVLCVEYRAGATRTDAPAFEAAWERLERPFRASDCPDA